MDSRGQYFSKFTVALLLMVFVFALGNMIFNLENLDLGGENVPEFMSGSAQQDSPMATSPGLADALRWVYFGFLGYLLVILVIGAYSFTKSKEEKKWRNLFYQMLSSFIVIALIVAMGVFYEDIENTMDMGGSTEMLPGGGSANASVDDVSAVPDGPDAAKVISTFAIFSLVFSLWALIFIALVRVFRTKSTKLDYSDLDLRSREVAETLQRSIDALAGGSDTRATVIRCYTDMCKVMAKHGVVEEEHLTPREFEELAKKNLPVPDKQIHDLVLVFEEARYSDHLLSKEDSQRAFSALEAVKERLLGAEPEGPGEGSDGE